MVVSVDKSVHGMPISSSYQFDSLLYVTPRLRGDPQLKKEMAETILTLLPKIPGNVIIFFPSYGYMLECSREWSHDGTMDRIMAVKDVYQEEVGMSTKDFNSIVHQLEQAVFRKGAILMAVCRGKASEGIDFSDAMCRAVIIIGIPFAPYTDLKVKLRRDYLDERLKQQEKLNKRLIKASSRGQDLRSVRMDDLPLASIMNFSSQPYSGSEWYRINAHRAVNQSIGRAIRHNKDYGAILLMDDRYTSNSSIQQLSKWMQPFYRPMQSVSRYRNGSERKMTCRDS